MSEQQPVWDEAWQAWLSPDPQRPDRWLIWSEAHSVWQPLPASAATEREHVRAPVLEAEQAPLPAALHANGPLRSAPAGTPAALDPAVRTVPAPQIAVPPWTADGPEPLPGPFVQASADQLIAAPAPRASGSGTLVLGIGVGLLAVGVLVTLIGLLASLLFSLGVGGGSTFGIINLLAVVAFVGAATGVALGVLQLRSGTVAHRSRTLLGLGVCGTVLLLLLGRFVNALANTLLLDYPFL